MRYLKTGVANVIDIGPAVIGTTGGTLVSPVTGLTNATVDEVGVYKHGATALTSTTASAITHRAGGIYTLSLSTAHVDTLGRLTFYLRDDSACLPIRHEFTVLPANTYDGLVGSTSTLLDVDANTVGDKTGYSLAADQAVNVTKLRGSSQSAIDLQDFADAGYDPATNKVQGVVLVDTVTTLTGHTAQTGDSYTRLGAPAGASVSADIAAIEAQTDDIGVAGAGLTAVPWNAAWDAEVQSEVTDALVAANLDHVALTGTTVAVPQGTYLGRIMNASTSGTYDRTTDSLEAIRNRGDAAWTTGVGGSTAGVNVIKIGGSSQSLLDLKDFADAGYDPATNKVEGVKLADVTTTNTDMRGTDSALLAASAPTNFGSMAISTGGAVTVGTNNDKTGYSLAADQAVNVTKLRGSSQSAIDLQDFADAGYDPATNKVEGVKLADVTTTNTDMRGTDSAFLAASAPTNFGVLSISTSGQVPSSNMRGTDSAFLAASAPTNFGSLTISTSGRVDSALRQIVNTSLQGVGTTASPWRPV